ncbi:MAG: hypothetical protein VW450_06945, partial [Chloroflexota bacterium]
VTHVSGAEAWVEAAGIGLAVNAAGLAPGAPVTVGLRPGGLVARAADGAEANASLAQDLRAGLRGGPVRLRLDGGPEVTVDLGSGSLPWAGPALPTRWWVEAAHGAALVWPQDARTTSGTTRIQDRRDVS